MQKSLKIYFGLTIKMECRQLKYLKVEADVRVEKVTSLLPGYNCGGCGFPGCSGMAEALVTGDMDHIACKPCKAEKRQEIVDYLKNTPGPDGSTVEVKG